MARTHHLGPMILRWDFFYSLVAVALGASGTNDAFVMGSRGSGTCNFSLDVSGQELVSSGVWLALDNASLHSLALAAQHASPPPVVSMHQPSWLFMLPRLQSLYGDILHAIGMQTGLRGRRAVRSSRRAAQRSPTSWNPAFPKCRSALARRLCLMALLTVPQASARKRCRLSAPDRAILSPQD